MLIGTTITAIGLGVAIVYFVLFYRTFGSAPDQAERYTREFLGRRKIDWIVPVLVLIALIINNLYLSIALLLIAFAWGGYAAFAQDLRMRQLGFDASFRKRLLKISTLAPIAIVFFVAGQFWHSTVGL